MHLRPKRREINRFEVLVIQCVFLLSSMAGWAQSGRVQPTGRAIIAETSLVRTISTTVLRDTDSNVLGSYCMLHLIVRLNRMGGTSRREVASRTGRFSFGQGDN